MNNRIEMVRVIWSFGLEKESCLFNRENIDRIKEAIHLIDNQEEEARDRKNA